MKTSVRVIGLTGTNGAGKGEAAAFFATHAFKVFSLSDIIREDLKKKAQPLSRDNMIRAGNTLRRSFGADVLARRTLKRIRGRSVIDSIRNPSEVEHLRTHPGFILLTVDAPAAIRFSRVLKRGRIESASTLEEFSAKEKEEMSADSTSQQLHACMALADHTIINDGTLEDLHRQLEIFL